VERKFARDGKFKEGKKFTSNILYAIIIALNFNDFDF
jgi:hypothetical protein